MKKVIAVLALVLAVGAALFFPEPAPRPLRPGGADPGGDGGKLSQCGAVSGIDGHSLELTFQNNSDSWLASGASVDRNNDFFFHGGLDVFLDGNGIRFPGKTSLPPVWAWS